MKEAVANGDLEFFKQQKDAFVGPFTKATFTTTKGWYSLGEVLSYIALGKAKLVEKEEYFKLLVAGVRQAMQVDLDMADSRVGAG
jgi:hypothetical protein